MTAKRLLAGVAMTLAAAACLSPLASAITPRTSLTAVEAEVMCVACKTPLAVAQSPEANAERQFISSLIARGDTKSQITRVLVAQYGPAVLALPPAHGFNLTVYILPPALVLIGVALLAYTLPRWRRRTRAAAAARAASASELRPLEPADALRLDQDLARYD